ncbi:hypothetical protein HN51_009884 [Arachis hypogaea]
MMEIREHKKLDALDTTSVIAYYDTSPFEKLIRGSKLKTLDGPEYVRKVSENCVAYMKSVETFGDAEEKAIHEFRQAFKDQNFLPGSTVFYEQFPNGTLGVKTLSDEELLKAQATTATVSSKTSSAFTLPRDPQPEPKFENTAVIPPKH